jgi:hypothetical protein
MYSVYMHINQSRKIWKEYKQKEYGHPPKGKNMEEYGHPPKGGRIWTSTKGKEYGHPPKGGRIWTSTKGKEYKRIWTSTKGRKQWVSIFLFYL